MKLKCPKCKNKYFDKLTTTVIDGQSWGGSASLRCKICQTVYEIDMESFDFTIVAESYSLNDPMYDKKPPKTVFILGVVR